MKKIFAVFLALCLCVGLLPSAFADEASLVEKYVELSHKVYEANTADALFAAHKSVAYSYICPVNDSFNGFEYQTADSRYAEWGLNKAAYTKDRIVYQMFQDEETGNLDMYCGAELNRDYRIHYTFSPDTEEDFVDLEHDQPTDIFEKDGFLHICSRYDEEMSRGWIEYLFSQEYAGQLISDESIVDPESYEIVQSMLSVEQDGEMKVIYIMAAEYDQPEPIACRILRAGFERDSENMMKLAVVADAGTDHELSVNYTVPVNCENKIFYDGPVVLFDDADGTVLTHWDRMSDHTWYVFTEPDDALAERYQTMVEELEKTPAE